jgi:hypothetical protein
MFRKRSGSTAPNIGATFTGTISSLIPHYPDNNPAHAEMWGADDATPPIIGRMAGASTFSAPTLTDTPSNGAGPFVRGVSYIGKLYLAYQSAVDRLHVYDPNLAAPRVRRAGLAAPVAPTVANTGGGTYPATARYYRQRYRILHGVVCDAESEPSPSVAFTPSGSGTGAVITKAATINESETDWVLEGSADNITFYEIVDLPIGTTTYTDTATPSSYASLPILSPLLGAYANFTSVKYVCEAFNRVFGMGSWNPTTTPQQSRVWYTPSAGTSDNGDSERVPNALTVRNWIDLGEGIGGDGRGFAGPIYGAIYVFKYNQIQKLLPTGATSPVFDVIELSNTRGAIEQECIVMGEDTQGRPAVYFMDPQVGPMMIGATAPLPIGDPIRNLWDTVNLAATANVGHIVDYPNKGQVWFWFATGASNDANVLAIYTKSTGGWEVWDTGGQLRLSRCAVLFPRVLGATMSRDKVPYVGYTGVANTLLRADTADLSDNGTAFQAQVKTRPYAFNKGKSFRTTDPVIIAQPAAGVILTVVVDMDFGRELRTNTIDLTLTASEAVLGANRVVRPCKGLDADGASFVQYQIGDSAAVANAWQVEQMFVEVFYEDTLP